MADGSSDGSAEKTQASLRRALRCNARCLLLCGSFATLLAAYACLEPVTLLFVPELGWFLLIPSLLLLLLGLVSLGLLSMGNPSKLFQSQLAIFTFLMALLLASAGVFVFHYVAAASHWVFDGCVKYRTEGIWSHNRMRPKLQAAHEEYEQLLCGFKRCRLLNPLTLDLAECGPRARCKGAGSGDRVDSLRFYNWMQHVQVRALSLVTVGCIEAPRRATGQGLNSATTSCALVLAGTGAWRHRSRRASIRRAVPEALLACLGGGVGATCRFGISKFGAARGWSVWSTLATNVLGCLLLALVTSFTSNTQRRILLGTGFCGGFTTFSTFAVEAIQLIRKGLYGTAACYILLSNLMGFLVVAITLRLKP
eukprot:symbB.v1.2.005141.t1/scaffold226.1/size261315/20